MMNQGMGTRWQPNQEFAMNGGSAPGFPMSSQQGAPAKLLSMRLPSRQGGSAQGFPMPQQGRPSGQPMGGGDMRGFLSMLSQMLQRPQGMGPMGGGMSMGQAPQGQVPGLI